MAPRHKVIAQVFVPDWLDQAQGEEHEHMTEAFNSWLPSWCNSNIEEGPLSIVDSWLRRRKDMVSCTVRRQNIRMYVPDRGPVKVKNLSTLRTSVLTPAKRPLVAQSVDVVFENGEGHSTVLFLDFDATEALYYDPHGMYSTTNTEYARCCVALSAALNAVGWHMGHVKLRTDRAMQAGSDLGLCAFYTAFAVLLVGVNPPDTMKHVIWLLHDATMQDTLARWFQRFAHHVSWLAARRVLSAGMPLRPISDECPDRIVRVTRIDPQKRCVYCKTRLGEKRFSLAHVVRM